MTAKYWQKGEVLDYKASAAVKNLFECFIIGKLLPAQ